MRFSGLVKGDRTAIGDISRALREHGMTDTWRRLMVRRHREDTYFEIEAGERSLERALHAWFQAPPIRPPFPEGTLLHFSYRDEEEGTRTEAVRFEKANDPQGYILTRPERESDTEGVGC